MRPPRAASSDGQILADTLTRMRREAGGRIGMEHAARRRGRTGTGGDTGGVRVGTWQLVDERGALVAVNDDGRRVLLAGAAGGE